MRKDENMGRAKNTEKNMKNGGKNTKHTGKHTKRTAWKKTKHKNNAAQKRKRQTVNHQTGNRQIESRKTGNQRTGNRQAGQISVGPVRDGNSRMIFKNSMLCAQFLRDNFDIPVLKDIKPEDISDVTEKYRAYLGIHFEADTVKKIRLPGEETPELFLVSLIEHKSKVDYNIAMQMLRYMVCIWTEYAKEMEARQAGISRTKGFRYPPILPIVYYEGIENWTADRNLKDRIALKDIFGEYFPDFTYKVVRLHE